MTKLFVTEGKRISFTLGVGRKAYNTRDIVAPTASKPSAQYSFAAPQDGEEAGDLAEPISTSPARPEKPQQRQASKLREREWLTHLQVDENGSISFEPAQAQDSKTKWFGLGHTNPEAQGVEVVGERRQIIDLSDERIRTEQEELTEADALVKQPKYLPGYVTWEHQAGQHDPITDIFSLGLILATAACGLDLTDDDDFQIFVDNRAYLFAVNSRLNPVIASAIVQMTELQRSRRAQDLPSLIRRLKNYREQPTEYDFDFQRIEGFRESNLTGKRRLIQSHLRDRLFEISRRNRLLYFKPTQQHVNLTLASVPAVLDYRHIKHEQLFVWHDQLADLLAKQSVITNWPGKAPSRALVRRT